MPNKIRKRVMPQMHDVRFVDGEGNFDFSRINNCKNFSKKNVIAVSAKKEFQPCGSRRSILANTGDIRVFPRLPEKKKSQKLFEAEKVERPRNSFRSESSSGSERAFSVADKVSHKVFVPKFQSIPQKMGKAKIYQFGQIFDADNVPMFHQAQQNIEKRTGVTEKKREAIFAPIFAPKESNSTNEVYQFVQAFDLDSRREAAQRKEDLPVRQTYLAEEKVPEIAPSLGFSPTRSEKASQQLDFSIGERLHEKIIEKIEQGEQNFKESLGKMFSWTNLKKQTFSFSAVALGILLVVSSIGFFNKGLQIRDTILGTGKAAYFDLAVAKDGMVNRDFQKSSLSFSEAEDKFESISRDINDLAGIIVPASRYIPYLSKLSSGDNMAQAGKDVSRIGILAGEMMQTMDAIKNPLDKEVEAVSFLEIFKQTDKDLREILELVNDAEDRLAKVNVDDIPEGQRVQFVELRGKLPEVKEFIQGFLESSQIMTDVLGGNGPRKYLFLFQNNQEMRATGGFIGTYGVLDIFNGRVRNFFIDGIYNPDGQLREKIVPPEPIQKMSANWSLHDSNWFPDFPKSAEKAAWFYEKTGGPTVDGVITMTPNVMQRLLEVTGPIEMEEYGVTVDSHNFVETVQQEVEVDYDKGLNQPKKILADLAPKILDRIFNTKNFSDLILTLNILMESLNEKQILIYSKNYDIEKLLSQEGWSGEILNTQKDYLSVINTNINGYKTDGVIDEEISHQADIQSDGSIMDTVTITRRHNGGSLEKDWWNKVNADYMRVYVPKGSKLLSAEGQTREFNSPPLDYKKLGFKRDAQLLQEEESMRIDEESGTRVYEDGEKTVFANWVYVSPQETVVVKYTYLLPFKIDMGMEKKPADTYSLLAQKQSGSVGSKFFSSVTYPQYLQMIWSYPEGAKKEESRVGIETDLREDRFLGTAFTLK